MSYFDKTLNNSTDTATQTCGRHGLIFLSLAAALLKSNASHYKDSNQPFPVDGKQLPAGVSGYSWSITSKISYLRQQEFQGCCSLPSAPWSSHIYVWSCIKIETPILKNILHFRFLRHNFTKLQGKCQNKGMTWREDLQTLPLLVSPDYYHY